MSDPSLRPASQIAQSVRQGEVTAQEVTEAALARHAQLNPKINAIVQDCHAEARIRAAEIDQQVADGIDPGPLAGVPTTIKVNVDQKGFATTNGLRLNENLIARQDSPFVANLRAAGCVIIGRTNTPAFSLRWFTKNSLHGQTLNPRNAAITPGGSSGGAASAVAAGLCAIGHGTDIAGSIRYPAYACGVHGLRPSLGRIPTFNATSGDRFIGAQLMAVSGPLARSIDDIALSYRAMAGISPNDPASVPATLEPRPYAKRAALCLEPDAMSVSPQVKSELIRAAKILQDEGWSVEEIPCPPVREAAEINAILWMAETIFAATDAMEAEADEDAQFVYAQMRETTGPVDLERVMTALKRRATLIRAWENFFSTHPVLICPISGELPFEQQLDVRSAADFERVYEAQLTQRGLAVMGMPALSVATGFTDDRPTGAQLVSGRFREDVLLDAGATLEAACGAPEIAHPA